MARKDDNVFTIDPDIEAVLKLRDTDPDAWYALKPYVKITCACYEGCKEHALSAGWRMIECEAVPV